MSYDLFIGDRSYSSWSYRGWLMLEKFGLPYRTITVGLYSGTMAKELAVIAPARTVPALRTPEGDILTDSLAMAETLAERHPEAGLWPGDRAARALARSMVCEMHSGFVALRSACPNSIVHVWKDFAPSDAVLADLARIEQLWSLARSRHGDAGPWLFGAYSLADAYFAPVACRIVTYGLPVSDAARRYVRAQISDPAFGKWRADALKERHDGSEYPMTLPKADWPAAY